MSSLLRTLISLAFLAGALWFSFAVELGDRTLAQHIDRIGQTPEARELVEGTRSTVNPMLQEATDRMLGEHIEAPIRADPDDKRAGGDPHRHHRSSATIDGRRASIARTTVIERTGCRAEAEQPAVDGPASRPPPPSPGGLTPRR